MTLDEKPLPEQKQLRFFMVRIEEPAESPEEAEENLAELCFLVESAGYQVGATQAYGWRRPDPATYLTKGRMEEIKSRLSQGTYGCRAGGCPCLPRPSAQPRESLGKARPGPGGADPPDFRSECPGPPKQRLRWSLPS
jgi:hypothetical protein